MNERYVTVIFSELGDKRCFRFPIITGGFDDSDLNMIAAGFSYIADSYDYCIKNLSPGDVVKFEDNQSVYMKSGVGINEWQKY